MNTLDDAFRFNATALKVGAQRQQVIAANLANADTPGFKASEVDFASALARATGAAPKPVVAAVTQRGHIGAGSSPDGAGVLSSADVRERAPTQPAIDGNTVDADAERAAFADNTVRYEASFTFLNHQIKTLMSAIQG